MKNLNYFLKLLFVKFSEFIRFSIEQKVSFSEKNFHEKVFELISADVIFLVRVTYFRKWIFCDFTESNEKQSRIF